LSFNRRLVSEASPDDKVGPFRAKRQSQFRMPTIGERYRHNRPAKTSGPHTAQSIEYIRLQVTPIESATARLQTEPV
jgi:hypothetical protein